MLAIAHLLGAAKRPDDCWTLEGIQDLASREIAAELLGSHRELLQADVKSVWIRWFIEAIFDLSRLQGAHFAQLYKIASGRIDTLFPDLLPDERLQIGRDIAHVAKMELHRRETRKRVKIPHEQRRRLLISAGVHPRCWICGSLFAEKAIERFVTGDRIPIEQPPYVDFLKPRGLNERDLHIEVDHVVPFAAGGSDAENLRLACGWCNRVKSNRVSLYNVSSMTIDVQHPKLGTFAAPQPFWIIRLLAVRRRCEHPDGCRRTVDNTELTIAPKHAAGSVNPINMLVCCTEHDPLRINRLVPRRVLASSSGSSN